jgi:hypothetical protein
MTPRDGRIIFRVALAILGTPFLLAGLCFGWILRGVFHG